jgi:hypothetical protein
MYAMVCARWEGGLNQQGNVDVPMGWEMVDGRPPMARMCKTLLYLA